MATRDGPSALAPVSSVPGGAAGTRAVRGDSALQPTIWGLKIELVKGFDPALYAVPPFG